MGILTDIGQSVQRYGNGRKDDNRCRLLRRQPKLSRRPGIVGRRWCCFRGGRRRGGKRWRWGRRRSRRRRRRCRGHGGRCRRTGGGCDGFLFLRNQLFRRCHRPQVHANRVGRESRPSGGALRLRTHRQGLWLITAERKRHREFATGLDRKLAGRATALAQRGFRFRPRRLRLDGQRLGLRRRLQEVQAGHRCGTCGQHEATRHEGNDSAHD